MEIGYITYCQVMYIVYVVPGGNGLGSLLSTFPHEKPVQQAACCHKVTYLVLGWAKLGFHFTSACLLSQALVAKPMQIHLDYAVLMSIRLHFEQRKLTKMHWFMAKESSEKEIKIERPARGCLTGKWGSSAI